jgi:hypothetical protein
MKLTVTLSGDEKHCDVPTETISYSFAACLEQSTPLLVEHTIALNARGIIAMV